MASWIITIPKSVTLANYQVEIDQADRLGAVLNYRVPHDPGVKKGDLIWVCYKKRVRGFMKAVGCVHYPHGFTCPFTGIVWPAGWYVQRTGPFIPSSVQYMQSFRGIRRYYGCDEIPEDA
jgi:hypothetical protein